MTTPSIGFNSWHLDPVTRGLPLGIPSEVLTDPKIIGTFWGLVQKMPAPRGYTGCWIWRGEVGKASGPVLRFYINARHADGRKKRVCLRARRLAMALMSLDFDPGKYLAPRCMNKLCVNPAHMDQVGTPYAMQVDKPSRAKHKQFCLHGHEMTPENTRIRYYPDKITRKRYPSRVCLTCTRKTQRENKRRQRESRK